jgi:hypothetical protein
MVIMVITKMPPWDQLWQGHTHWDQHQQGHTEVLRGRAQLALPLVTGMVRRTSAFLALAHGGVE